MRRHLFAVLLAALVGSLLFGGIAAGSKRVRPVVHKSVLVQAALGKAHAASIPVHVRQNGRVVTVERKLPYFSAGMLQSVYGSIEPGEKGDELNDPGAKYQIQGHGSPGGRTLGCGNRDSRGNVRVNQDCTYRRQAEEDITYNPTDPNNLVAGQNDSRVGFNQCGIDWSTNNGSQWGDMLPPFRQRFNDPEDMGPTADNPNDNSIGHDPGDLPHVRRRSDPAHRGRRLRQRVLQLRRLRRRRLRVGRIRHAVTEQAKGSFYYNVPSPPSKMFMAVEDNRHEIEHDKNMISADRYRQSPNAGNVYVTWTVFRFSPNCGHPPTGDENFCSSPIFGSMSTDGGQSLVDARGDQRHAPGLCFFGNFFDPGASPSALRLRPGLVPGGAAERRPRGHLQQRQHRRRATRTRSSSACTAGRPAARPTAPRTSTARRRSRSATTSSPASRSATSVEGRRSASPAPSSARTTSRGS